MDLPQFLHQGDRGWEEVTEKSSEYGSIRYKLLTSRQVVHQSTSTDLEKQFFAMNWFKYIWMLFKSCEDAEFLETSIISIKHLQSLYNIIISKTEEMN